MPFGHENMIEKADQEKAGQRDEPKSGRKYIDITCLTRKDGRLVPKSITWADGREFAIAGILDCRQGKSLKLHTGGMRYSCLIGDETFYLYYDGEKKWYVE